MSKSQERREILIAQLKEAGYWREFTPEEEDRLNRIRNLCGRVGVLRDNMDRVPGLRDFSCGDGLGR